MKQKKMFNDDDAEVVVERGGSVYRQPLQSAGEKTWQSHL
jgi:hypothetical protein